MIHAINATKALQTRRTVTSAGTGVEHWSTDFIGGRSAEVKAQPQALFIEMSSNEKIVSHFHAVEQFQVFVAGSGSLGRHNAEPVTLQYVDRHTGYGPILAGPQGLSYFVLRARTDSGAVYLDQPGYREKLRPSKKRNRMSARLLLSTEPVLASGADTMMDALLDQNDCSDGVGAFMLRLGANGVSRGPDSRNCGGYYALVLNGTLMHAGESLPIWSTVFVDHGEMPMDLLAGPRGLEALIMCFPLPDGQ